MEELPERRSTPRRRPDDDVQVELTRLAFDKLLGIVTLGSVSMIASTALLASHYADYWLWHLTAAMCLICAFRLVIVFAFTKRVAQTLTVRSARRRELLYGVATILYMSAIAGATWRNFRHLDFVGCLWCTLGTCSYCAALGARLSLAPWIAKISGLIPLGTLAVVVSCSKEMLVRLTAIPVLFYLYAYFQSINNKHDVVVDQIRIRRKLHDLSEQDALTGLANRRRFQTLLDQATGSAYAVLYLDLDRFKAVNDTFGHGVGDALLMVVAERLRWVVRSTDVLARLGGDEFAILQYPDATQSTAEALAARITGSIAQPYTIGADTMTVGVSVGICLPSGPGFDTERAMKMADRALYAVKREGGGRFSVAS